MLVNTEKGNIPGLLIMTDLERAFDIVAWSSMQGALDFFNFDPESRQWFKTFYKSANMCTSLNGQYSGWFSIQTGVRQGAPSLPYLYLICAEILLAMIRQNNFFF